MKRFFSLLALLVMILTTGGGMCMRMKCSLHHLMDH